jgi:hypothetical protein
MPSRTSASTVIPAETVGGSLTHHALDRHILEDILDEHLSGLQYVGIDQDIFNLANLLAIAGTDDRIPSSFWLAVQLDIVPLLLGQPDRLRRIAVYSRRLLRIALTSFAAPLPS